VAGTVAERREGLLVNDYRSSPYATPIFLEQTNVTAVMGEPLLYHDRLLGAITVDNEDIDRPFTEQDRDILALLVTHAAIAIENARLFAATQRAAREARSLYQVAHSLTTSLHVAEVLHLIAAETTELLGTPHAQVVLWDEDSRTLRLGAAYGTEADTVGDQVFRLGEGVNGIVARTKSPLVVNDYQAFPNRIPGLTALVADIAVPLLYRGRLLGVLNSHTTQPGSAFTQNHLALLTSFADQAAIAIENARLYEQVKQHAEGLERRVGERTAELLAVNQQLQEVSRHKSEFLANMSHELRTPLNSILGFSQLLQEQTANLLSEKQTRYLTHIHNSGQHLLQLINDILDLSRVEAGKLLLQPEALAVAAALEEILVIARGLGQKKGQTVEAQIEADLPPLRADPVRFKQICFNLLSNAVKFTPDGGTVRVTARRVNWSSGQSVDSSGPIDKLTYRPIDPDGDLLEIAVSDTGIGIRPEDLPRLFQEFVQLETTRAQHREGTGLGLALTSRLVESHGGRIWAASEGEGRGSTFTVVLPLAGPGGPADAPAEGTRQGSPATRG
jgi:signal transduction histidine kinase